jgi:hypothetical protein
VILFHVTEHKNLPSILTGGLIPAYRRGLTRSRRTGFRMHVLWLTDNFWWILNRQVAQPELHSVIVLNCEGL